MTKLIALMSMSLDGYVADLDDGVAEVFEWGWASPTCASPCARPSHGGPSARRRRASCG